MGTPKGCPYACPMGACINGVGALPTPYGPTLRGAHNGPSGLQKIKSKYVNQPSIIMAKTCANQV